MASAGGISGATDVLLAQAAGDYREWPAAAPLRDHVQCAWHNIPEGSPSSMVAVVPDGCIDILWTGADLLVAGPDTQPIVSRNRPGAALVGLRFRPGRLIPWLGVPATDLVNGRLRLEELWGRQAGRLAEALSESRNATEVAERLQSALLERLAVVGLPDVRLPILVERIARGGATRGLARELGFSERTFRRRCEEWFGYGPRTLARILRFQRFVRSVASGGHQRLADLAASSGFADQAHLTREVQRLAGLTPARLVAQMGASGGLLYRGRGPGRQPVDGGQRRP